MMSLIISSMRLLLVRTRKKTERDGNARRLPASIHEIRRKIGNAKSKAERKPLSRENRRLTRQHKAKISLLNVGSKRKRDLVEFECDACKTTDKNLWSESFPKQCREKYADHMSRNEIFRLQARYEELQEAAPRRAPELSHLLDARSRMSKGGANGGISFGGRTFDMFSYTFFWLFRLFLSRYYDIQSRPLSWMLIIMFFCQRPVSHLNFLSCAVLRF